MCFTYIVFSPPVLPVGNKVENRIVSKNTNTTNTKLIGISREDLKSDEKAHNHRRESGKTSKIDKVNDETSGEQGQS